MLNVLDEAHRFVSYEPAPAWADRLDEFPQQRPSREQSHGGRSEWLSDTQINLLLPEPAWITRNVYEVTSSEGLQEAGSISIDISPGYQTLTFHHLRVLRDGVARSIDPLEGLELLRRERDLERATFDGRLTALLTIPDLRIGDVIDICHTLVGEPPVLGGHFSAECLLGWGCWVGETRVRLIAASDRSMTFRNWSGSPEGETTTDANQIVRTWRTLMTPPVEFEPSAPAWVRPFPSIQMIDTISWTAIAETFRGYYLAEPMPAELETAVADIEAETNSAEARAIKALRLVQSTLRYHAVTIGDGGFVPRSLDRIWSTRAGDCKDASRLLTAVLLRLGITAEPVLVHTRRGPMLNEEQPSLIAFNHCVVGLTINGRRHWFDPTLAPQGGRLELLREARFGFGLPLRAEAELEDMGQDSVVDSFRVFEIYELPRSPSSSGRHEIRTSYFGWRADSIRRKLASGLEDYTRELTAYHQRRLNADVSMRPLGIKDDLQENRLEVTEVLEFTPAWQRADGDRVKFEVVDDFFQPNLPSIARETRRHPVALGPSLDASSSIEIRLPVATSADAWNVDNAMPGLMSASKFAASDGGKVLRLERKLSLSRAEIDPGEAGALRAFSEETMHEAGVLVRHPVRDGRLVSAGNRKQPFAPLRVAYYAIVGLWLLAGVTRCLTIT